MKTVKMLIVLIGLLGMSGCISLDRVQRATTPSMQQYGESDEAYAERVEQKEHLNKVQAQSFQKAMVAVGKTAGDYGKKQSEQSNARLTAGDDAASKAAKYHNKQAEAAQPATNIDYKCKQDCEAAGYAHNLCQKQCSY